MIGEKCILQIDQLVDRLCQVLLFADDFIDLLFQDLRVEKLLGVFPFINGFGFVQSFVALQQNQFEI